MSRFNFFNLGAWGRGCLLTGLVLFTWPAQGQYDPDWTRYLRVGAIGGLNLKADFKMTGQFNISGAKPGPTGVGGVDHIYDDGYVRVDATGNSGTGPGQTTYWGYQDASQYDAGARTLLMHSSTSFTASHDAKGDDSAFAGFELAYGGDIHHWGWKRISWDFGFGLLPISISDKQPVSATVNRTAHSFSVPAGVIVPTVPPAYHGGSAGHDMPVIFDVATPAGSDTVSGMIDGSRRLEVILYSVKAGPSLFLDLTPRWGVSVGAGPVMGIVSGEYRFDESIVLPGGGTARNKGKIEATDVVYGGYVNAAVTYHAMGNGDLYLGVQYMPLGSSTIAGQGRQARLDLSGQVYVSAGINWPF
jgi:hypothetical protein